MNLRIVTIAESFGGFSTKEDMLDFLEKDRFCYESVASLSGAKISDLEVPHDESMLQSRDYLKLLKNAVNDKAYDHWLYSQSPILHCGVGSFYEGWLFVRQANKYIHISFEDD